MQLPVDGKAPADTGATHGKLIEGTDCFAEVFPEHKFMVVEALKQRGWTCGMTGDGVNDAPALKAANIGIAVQGATDAVQAAADIVLTDPGLCTIVDAIVLSRETFQRLRNYVIYRISCTTQLLVFFFIGVVMIQVASSSYTGMSPSCQGMADALPAALSLAAAQSSLYNGEEALVSDLCHKQFELPVTAIILITILNDGTIISIAYDKVVASRRPAAWRLTEVSAVSSLLGVVAVASSVVMLLSALPANAEGSWFELIGVVSLPTESYSTEQYAWQSGAQAEVPCPEGGCSWAMCDPPATWVEMTVIQQLEWQQPTFCFSYGEVQTTLYLQISLSTYLTIWSARTRNAFFSRQPGVLLFYAAVCAMVSSTLLAACWPFPDMKPIPWPLIAKVWAYCIAWFLLQDSAKLLLYAGTESFYGSAIELEIEEKKAKVDEMSSRTEDQIQRFDEDRKTCVSRLPIDENEGASRFAAWQQSGRQSARLSQRQRMTEPALSQQRRAARNRKQKVSWPDAASWVPAGVAVDVADAAINLMDVSVSRCSDDACLVDPLDGSQPPCVPPPQSNSPPFDDLETDALP